MRYLLASACLSLFYIGCANALGFYGYASVRGGASRSMVKTELSSNGGLGSYIPVNDWNFSFNPNFGTYIIFNNWKTGAFRLEAEYRIAKKISVETNTVNYGVETKVGLTNLYFEFYTRSRFRPFVFGGIGYGQLKLTEESNLGVNESYSAKNMVWSAGGGIAYALASNIYFDVMYRYTDFGKTKSTNLEKLEYISSDFLLGLRYVF